MVALSFLAFSDGGVGSSTGCGGLLSPLCSGPFVNWRYGPPCFHLFFNRFPLCFNLSLNGGHGSRESIGKAVRPTIESNWNADGKQWVAIPHHQRMNWNKGGTRPPRTVTSQTDSIDLEWGGMAASCSQALSVEGVSSFTGCGGLITPLCSRLFDNRSMVPCVFHFFFNCFPLCFNLS